MPSSTCVNSAVPVGHMKALNPTTPPDAREAKCSRLSVINPPHRAKSTTDAACAACTLAVSAAAVTVGGIALRGISTRSEEHTSELQSLAYLVCRLLLEKKKKKHLRELSQLPLPH